VIQVVALESRRLIEDVPHNAHRIDAAAAQDGIHEKLARNAFAHEPDFMRIDAARDEPRRVDAGRRVGEKRRLPFDFLVIVPFAAVCQAEDLDDAILGEEIATRLLIHAAGEPMRAVAPLVDHAGSVIEQPEAPACDEQSSHARFVGRRNQDLVHERRHVEDRRRRERIRSLVSRVPLDAVDASDENAGTTDTLGDEGPRRVRACRPRKGVKTERDNHVVLAFVCCAQRRPSRLQLEAHRKAGVLSGEREAPCDVIGVGVYGLDDRATFG
jgi:hypothetical protein